PSGNSIEVANRIQCQRPVGTGIRSVESAGKVMKNCELAKGVNLEHRSVTMSPGVGCRSVQVPGCVNRQAGRATPIDAGKFVQHLVTALRQSAGCQHESYDPYDR